MEGTATVLMMLTWVFVGATSTPGSSALHWQMFETRPACAARLAELRKDPHIRLVAECEPTVFHTQTYR